MTSSPELLDLYRRTVMQHSREPHNFRRMENPDRQAEGHNPLCGDKITVYLKLDHEKIADLSYEAAGCAISMASASMMSDQIAGLDCAAADEQATAVTAAFSTDAGQTLPGDMVALAGVRQYPSRVRCALLPWRTLHAALGGETESVNTEKGD